MFNTIDDFKRAAEFFPAGRIIPQRILKGPRKLKQYFKFAVDCWAIPTPRGYVIAADSRKAGCAIRYCAPADHWTLNGKLKREINMFGSPYFKNGATNWTGNCGRTDEQWIDDLNNVLALCNKR